MLGLIGAAIGVVGEVFKYLNTEASRKYIDRLVELKLAIQHEEARGYDADDARLESMYKELKVIFDAAQQEVLIHMVKKP